MKKKSNFKTIGKHIDRVTVENGKKILGGMGHNDSTPHKPQINVPPVTQVAVVEVSVKINF